MTESDGVWRVTLTSPDDVMLELPNKYEQFVGTKFAELLAGSDKPRFVMDLKDRVVISSRQLGLILAIRKALAEQSAPLRLTGLSRGVRRLLDTTSTAQFFEID